MNYDWITSEMFQAKLAEIIDQHPASQLLGIPGIFEILAEDFNNDVLDALTEDRTDDE